jgi:DNA topoisomerase I
MSKDLIIVESPAKVKTIKKFLGANFVVDASVGHVRDLPTKEIGVDEEQSFRPKYQIIPSKRKVVSRLRTAAEGAGRVFLAPDPDREGEAIAWHVAELIRDKNPNLFRIQFNEITPRAVKEALKHPRALDEDLFNSQQARRILDRLVGYKISPLLWSKVRRGLSAGRVQSVALRLIVDREKERQAFIPEEYWAFKAGLRGSEPPDFEAELWKVGGKKAQVGNAEQAEALEADVRSGRFVVHEVLEKERQRQPKPPFITSTLQQDGHGRLNFSAKKTMTLAQQLYEGIDLGERGTTALITYMRTDSVRVAKEARNEAREWILSVLGEPYLPDKERVYKSKGSAQDAHEAIRPVDVTITPEMVKPYLSPDLYRLYTLIWGRFMASQMASARFWDTQIVIKAGRTLWQAKGERLMFHGFLKVYGGAAKEEKEAKLPKVHSGEELALLDLSKEQKFTQPPSRYTEASLVRKLEEQGIGRPSTYAAIISTLTERTYVKLEDKAFMPTELGTTVSDLLVEHFPRLMDVGFTAGMEEALDHVADGKENWIELLDKFSKDFNPTLLQAEENMARVKAGLETGMLCESCGQPMVIKFGKNGSFLACSGYPECKNTKNFTRDEKGELQVVVDLPGEQLKMGVCPRCNGDLVLKKARTGSRFVACSTYPECRYTEPFKTGVACPVQDCPGELVEKSSKRGKIFYSCTEYPKCAYALWDWPVAEACPECASKLLVRKQTKARGEHLACPSKACSYWRNIDKE